MKKTSAPLRDRSGPARPREIEPERRGAERQREKRHSRRPFPYTTIASALKKVMEAPTFKRRLEALPIAQEWESLMGAQAAQHVQPVALEKGVLTLEADSSVWRHQINLEKAEILQKIAARFDQKMVKQIRIR